VTAGTVPGIVPASSPGAVAADGAAGYVVAGRSTQVRVPDDEAMHHIPLTSTSAARGAELRDGNVVVTEAGYWQVCAYARVEARAGSRYGLACPQIGSANTGTGDVNTANGIITLAGVAALEKGAAVPVSASFVANGGAGTVQEVRLSAYLIEPFPVPPAGTGAWRNGTFTSFAVSDTVSVQVNVASGNLLVTTSDISVAHVSGTVTLGVAYNSLLAQAGFPATSNGNGWQQRLGGDICLYQSPGGNLVLFGPDGACGSFRPDGSSYHAPPAFPVFLVRSGSGWKMTWYQTGAVWEFNDRGRLASITDRNKNTITVEYNPAGEQTRLTCKPGGAKDPVRTVDASWSGGFLTRLSCDDGTGGKRTVTYQVSAGTANLEQVTQPDGTVIKLGYNAGNDLTSVTSGRDVTTRIGYDSQHRVTSVSQPLPDGTSAVTRFAYPSSSRTLAASPGTDQSQPVTGVPHITYQVDEATALVTSSTDQQGYTWTTSYTPYGDVAAAGNPLGAVTMAGYDANGGRSLTKVTYPTGFGSSLGYGNSPTPENPMAAYQPAAYTDTLGNSTAYTYAGPGNLVEATSALPARAKVDYNSDGTPKSSTDPGNGDNATTYSYDSAHQLEKITPVKDSSLRERVFTYDALGNLRSATDGAGHTVTYSRDDAGRVTRAGYTGGPHELIVTYEYDKAGNLTKRTDPSGTTTWDYDQRNNPVSRTSTHGGGTVTYTWTRCGKLATVTDDAGTTRYVYDSRGLLTALTDPAGNQWAFSYDASGNRTQTLFGITPASWAGQIITKYDQAGRIIRIQASRRTSGGQVTVTDTSYSYSNGSSQTGLVHSATNNITGVNLTHNYDKGGRLVHSTAGSHVFEYEYDSNGNITRQNLDGHESTWTHNPASQITGHGDYSYDGAGNQTSGPAAGTLTYNAAGQMTSATRHDSTEETFTYAGATQTELLSTGTATAITYGITGLRAYTPVGSTTPVYIVRDQAGTPLGLLHDGHCYAYVTDHLGNIAAIIGSDGTTRASYAYDPYGNLGYADGPLAGTNLLRYLGALNDPEGGKPGGTGWTHLGYRWLNHSDGRYTQQDTMIRLANPANANLYAYAADNPVNYTDPTGQSWWDPSWLQSAFHDIESWVDSWNWGCAAAVLGAAGMAVALVGVSVSTAGTADIFYGGYLIAVVGEAGDQLTFTGIGLGFLGSLAGSFAAC
jgi:RHS repeat-associated protein